MTIIKEAIFDLDHTLIDTRIIVVALRDAFVDRGITHERFDAAHARSCGTSPSGVGFYVPDRHAEELAGEGRAAADLEEALYRTLIEVGPRVSFSGAAELLGKLREDGWKLTLLTLGHDRWQRAKLAASGLAPHFHDVHTTETDKIATIAQLASAGCTVINDNPAETLAMRAAFPDARYLLKLGPKGAPEEYNLPIARTMEEIERFMLG